MLVWKLAAVRELHAAGIGIDAVDASLLQPDVGPPERLLDAQPRCIGVGAERHVDEVRAKQEVVPVGDDLEIDAT